MNMLFIKTAYAATPKAKDVISNSIVLKCMADYFRRTVSRTINIYTLSSV